MRVTIRFNPQDLWVGAYWEKRHYQIRIWVCLIPALPICLIFSRKPQP